MTTIMVYWALIIANEPSFVGSIHRTYETCYQQVVDLKRAGIDSACHPTRHPDVLLAAAELRKLASLFKDTDN